MAYASESPIVYVGEMAGIGGGGGGGASEVAELQFVPMAPERGAGERILLSFTIHR